MNVRILIVLLCFLQAFLNAKESAYPLVEELDCDWPPCAYDEASGMWSLSGECLWLTHFYHQPVLVFSENSTPAILGTKANAAYTGLSWAYRAEGIYTFCDGLTSLHLRATWFSGNEKSSVEEIKQPFFCKFDQDPLSQSQSIIF